MNYCLLLLVSGLVSAMEPNNGQPSLLLHLAAQGTLQGYTSDIQQAEAALKQGVSIDSKNGIGQTALLAAIIYCRKNMVIFLVERGADIHCKCELDFIGCDYKRVISPYEFACGDKYRFPAIANVIKTHNAALEAAAHSRVMTNMRALACVNHPRVGQNSGIQSLGVLMPEPVMRDINCLLHRDAQVKPADY